MNLNEWNLNMKLEKKMLNHLVCFCTVLLVAISVPAATLILTVIICVSIAASVWWIAHIRKEIPNIKRELATARARRHEIERDHHGKEIWDALDPNLQECAMHTFILGKRGRTCKLNQRGMSQLVQFLGEHGFEITKKVDI
jgi:hypothetical protein